MWDPDQYLAFGDRRARPGLELLARVDVSTPDLVVDLGCGPGHLTVHLRERWPAARLLAVDSSPEMLARARNARADLEVEWIGSDASSWEPPSPADVIYSNAVLHWLDDHASLLPRLVGAVAPGGAFAVQMPRNHSAASHQVAFEVARDGPWSAHLEPLLRTDPVASPQEQHELLAPHVADIDIWETEYLHVMDSADEIVEWTKGSLLRPLLAALEPDAAAEFESRYRDGIRGAYPPSPSGRVLFPFRRQFIVARR